MWSPMKTIIMRRRIKETIQAVHVPFIFWSSFRAPVAVSILFCVTSIRLFVFAMIAFCESSSLPMARALTLACPVTSTSWSSWPSMWLKSVLLYSWACAIELRRYRCELIGLYSNRTSIYFEVAKLLSAYKEERYERNSFNKRHN